MKKFKLSKVLLGSLVFFGISGTLVGAVSILPKQLMEILQILGPGGICATDYINSRVQLVLFLVLGGLVLISVVYALIAAFKYIKSEGDPGEMEKAQKSIKAIFFGLAAMIIAIIGIVLVFVIFGAKPTNPELFQTCISAAESVGCKACREDTSSDDCTTCEDAYQEVCNRYRGQNVSDSTILKELPAECKTIQN